MNRRIFLRSISALAFLPPLLNKNIKQHVISAADPNEAVCNEKFEYAVVKNLREKPINEIVVEIARSFIGVDYAANTIEAPGEERLVIDLQALDCVTFCENSLVLARCIKKNTLTFGDFKKELQFVRYRGGIINGYPSRLHYTSDYIFDNELKGVLKDITKDAGGVEYKKKINFMSNHPEIYPKLKAYPESLEKIREVENEMNRRPMYHILKKKVRMIAGRIKDGDILGITADIEGLDCSHTGIAVWQDKKLCLMHAPSPGKKIQITDAALWTYLKKIKKDLGIIIARPMEPLL